MIPGLVALGIAAVVGQAGGVTPAAELLRHVPADADVVFVGRGFEPVLDDLVAAAEAMSPRLGAALKPALEDPRQVLRRAKVDNALKEGPALSVIRLPDFGAGEPKAAVIVQAADYAAFQKLGDGGRAPNVEHHDRGYDVVTSGDRTMYTANLKDTFAVGNDAELLASIARPKERLGETLSADLRERLVAGDMGVYVNVAALHARYADQINEARKTFMALLDQVGQQGGNAEMMGSAKQIYGSMFDALGDGKALVLNVDVSAEGVTLAGQASAQPGSDTARVLQGGRAASAALLPRLPRGLAYYFDVQANPDMMRRMEGFGLSMLGKMGMDIPAARKAMEEVQAAKVGESASSAEVGRGAIRALKVSEFADPARAVRATTDQFRAVKEDPKAGGGFYKEVDLAPEVETYRGFTLSRARLTIDLQKFAAMQPNTPNAEASIKALIGETITTWYGTDGKVMLTVSEADWDNARTLIDTYLDGKGTLGEEPSYQTVRRRLPAEVGGLILLSTQGLARQLSTQFSAMMPDNPGLKLPADLPERPAFVGGAFTTIPDAVQFQIVVPSTVGPVVENGLIPMFSGLGGGDARP